MTIEQYLADLLKPQAWKGDKPTKPVLAPKMGDGKLLAEVTPIGSCPESWYVLIDSSYLLIEEDEQRKYQDEIHKHIESHFGCKWLSDLNKQDKEEMKS